jgi:hypothetical protein
MGEPKLPSKLIRVVKLTMGDTKSHVGMRSDLSAVITSKNGLRQGDALPCLLFNIVLDKLERDADIQTSDTVFYKFVQFLAYANYIGLIARSQPSLKEASVALESVAEKNKIYDYKSEYKAKWKYNHLE